jgi:alpha-N-arabinofuranosidase
VIDEHFYKSAEESFADAAHYDNADRNGPKILVGEWATREGAPTPNLQASLGDAAWMTGLERNSDVVIMAAYAPLFVNVNPGGTQWDTDLIGYDALSSYGSPSYWAQVIFSTYLGTEVVPGILSGTGPRVFASSTRDERKREIFIKIVNATSESLPLKVEVNGVDNVEPEVKLETLCGKTPNATNTIHQPDIIRPVEQKFNVSRPGFVRRFAPYSINALVLRY